MNRIGFGIIILSLLLIGVAGSSHVLAPNESHEHQFYFEEVAEEHGLNYRYAVWQRKSMGSDNPAGVYVTDFNNDGWSDLFVTRGAEPILYKNTGGSFERTSKLPDLPSNRQIRSVLFFDYNNDGWEDMLILTNLKMSDTTGTTNQNQSAHPLLLENNQGKFEVKRVLNVTLSSRTQEQPPEIQTIGATTADYNQDGCLDIFIVRTGVWRDRVPMGYGNSSTIGSKLHDDNGAKNILLKGGGEECSQFTNVSEHAGIQGERWSLATSFVDFTNDGYPDIHVANDVNQDVVYVNQKDGTFELVGLGKATDRNGMSSEVEDINSDQRFDIFVTNIASPPNDNETSRNTSSDQESFKRYMIAQKPRHRGNNLLINQEDELFTDKAAEYNVQKAQFVWGWAAVMEDFDNDRNLDLVHTNSKASTIIGSEGKIRTSSEDTYPAVWAGTNDKFELLEPQKVGLNKMNGRGIVSLDFDRDGDIDIAVADSGGQIRLYENTVEGGNWIQIQVKGSSQTLALGAEVYVTVNKTTQMKVQNAKADFNSQDSRTLHFGLNNYQSVNSIRVVWSDGSEQVFRDVQANQKVAITPNGSILQINRSVG